MNKIIPSTKLKVISGSKLATLACWRQYFWCYVLNMVPRKFHLPFWYGGVLGAGFEAQLLDEDWQAVMKRESKRRLKRYDLTPDDMNEIELQLQIIAAILKRAAQHPKLRRMSLTENQQQFKYRLKCGVLLCCTPDGRGDYSATECSFEIKTARTVSQDYLSRLKLDKQTRTPAWICRQKKLDYPAKCCYVVFKKVSKYIKKGQSQAEFIKEVKKDLRDRPEFYYIVHPFTLGKEAVTQTGVDIERWTSLLRNVYDSLMKDELLNPELWPKNDKQCLNYGACPYLPLCKSPGKWEMYLRLYTQREMLYKEEERELQK